MINWKLFLLALFACAITLVWAWNRSESAAINEATSLASYEECLQLAKRVTKIRAETDQELRLAAPEHDAFQGVRKAISDSGIKETVFLGAGVTVQKSASDRFERRQISAPTHEPITLQQLVQLLRELDASQPRYFVESVTLNAPIKKKNDSSDTSKSDEVERWMLNDLNINYFRHKVE